MASEKLKKESKKRIPNHAKNTVVLAENCGNTTVSGLKIARQANKPTQRNPVTGQKDHFCAWWGKRKNKNHTLKKYIYIIIKRVKKIYIFKKKKKMCSK